MPSVTTRDADGQLIVQTIIDESGQLTSYDARFQMTTTLKTPQRGRIEDVGRRPTSLQQLRARGRRQAERQESAQGVPTTVLEYRSAPTDDRVRGSAFSGLTPRELGSRFVAETGTGTLLRTEEFVVDDRGAEQTVRSTEWQELRVLDPGQVPARTLSPELPKVADRLNAVATQRFPVGQAANLLPFPLVVLADDVARTSQPEVTYTTGTRVDLSTLPVQYRGLEFAVERGDAAQIVYVADQTGSTAHPRDIYRAASFSWTPHDGAWRGVYNQAGDYCIGVARGRFPKASVGWWWLYGQPGTSVAAMTDWQYAETCPSGHVYRVRGEHELHPPDNSWSLPGVTQVGN